MAAYHFTSKIHSRGKGASAVRAAAYRAGERLVDERAGVTEDYSRKGDVVEAAILLPEGAPEWMRDRSRLWNAVEAREKRRDAQVAQEFEINLPREFSDDENWRLITDFCREHLVADGRVCDIAMHVRDAADGERHPHAHVLMPLRQVTAASKNQHGFGDKHPDVDWRKFLDRRDRLEELRELWCSYALERAASLGIDLGVDWDHRSFADRGLDLEGQPKLGAAAQRLEAGGEPTDRAAEYLKAQRRNGERLLAQPGMVTEALTSRQSTFTANDLARWVHRHTADDQFQPVLDKAKALAVCVGRDDQGRERFSTPEMIALEARMLREAGELAQRRGHRVTGVGDRLERTRLSGEQREAARALLEGGDLACLIGHAGAGKSTMLAEVRRELEAKGYTVRGAALSGIAAQNLAEGSGIASRTLHSLAYAWDEGRDRLTPNDVLVIDEAGMVGSRQLARFISAAGDVGAKIILVGDPEQLHAIEAGAAFRAIAESCETVELTEIRRQKEAWQREATRELATGETAAALARYRAAGAVLAAGTVEDARKLLVERWANDRAIAPGKSRIMLAHTRADVRALNDEARTILKAQGELGPEAEIETVNGKRSFAAGDRLLFLRNERGLDVRNGTLGTVEAAGAGRMAIRTDDGRLVDIDPREYRDIDHGYATTIHKAQGVTVDQSYVLATRGMDRHLAYVSMSRQREALTLVHAREAFPNEMELARILGRERAKDTTLDYWEANDAAEIGLEPEPVRPSLPMPLDVAALNIPALDIPAPRPTRAFLEQMAPERMQPPARELTELERMYDDLRQQALERERMRDLERRLDRDLGL